MPECLFAPADILLPAGDPSRWAVIACDQFTSQPEYWDEMDRLVGDAPSALRLIVPEARLTQTDETAEAGRIARRMEEYLSDGVLRTIPSSYVYVEREMRDGSFRKGLVGALDLEQYDYTPGLRTPVRATEETIVERLPARMAVRALAELELPHIMLLADENSASAFRLAAASSRGEPLYDFELMGGGGRIRGWAVSGVTASAVAGCFFPREGDVSLIIGDGNHSLAAARQHWLRLREGLDEDARRTHPARRCLAEVCMVDDPAVQLHPIHRVLFGCDPAAASAALRETLSGEGGLRLTLSVKGRRETLQTAIPDTGALTAAVQQLLDRLAAGGKASVDYIHGAGDAEELACADGALAILLPPMRRQELFAAAREGRIFPRKCFSIGEAREKRYYLEARRITAE